MKPEELLKRITSTIETAAEAKEPFECGRIAGMLSAMAEAASSKGNELMHSRMGWRRYATEAGHRYERAIETAERALLADHCGQCGADHAKPQTEPEDSGLH